MYLQIHFLPLQNPMKSQDGQYLEIDTILVFSPYQKKAGDIERFLQTMPERPHYRPELISLLLPRYWRNSTWGVVGRSTLAGNGVSLRHGL